MVIWTDNAGSCKYNYHTIMTTSAPLFIYIVPAEGSPGLGSVIPFYIYIVPAVGSPALGSVMVDVLGLT